MKGRLSMQDPLSSSLRKISRAKEHIAEFEQQMRTFLETNRRELIAEADPKNSQHIIHKIRFEAGLPDALTDALADAVHNLRSALDNASYGVAVSSGKVKPRSAYFPFAGSTKGLEEVINGRCGDVPESFYNLFRAFKPHREGDDVLWALNEVSVADKHTLLRVGLGSELGDFIGEGGVVTMWATRRWDREKHEIEIGTFVRDSHLKYKAEIGQFVAFDAVDVISGEPALKVLDYWLDIVGRIVSAMQATLDDPALFASWPS